MAMPTKPVVMQRTTKPPYELVCSTSFLLKRLGWAVKDRTFEAFEAAGESPYHHAVLAVLDESPRETQATIADSLGYDRSYLVGLLDELEEAGHIERKRDPADRRRHLVSLTASGKTQLEKLRKISRSIDDDFLAGLDATQRKELHQLLLTLARSHDPRYSSN
jgi:DNA-binding MarR family transcriptional regulator